MEKKRILVIDDDEAVLQRIARILELEGYKC
jgi:CheY-like chemotaxis protein